MAAEIVNRAERRGGQILAATEKAAGGDRRSEEFKTTEAEDLKTPRQEVGWKVSG